MTDADPAGEAPPAMERVRTAVAGLTSPWTLDDLSRALDEPAPKVQGYIERMLEGRSIEDVGADPTHEGDDPAPRLYSSHTTALGDD